MCLAWSSSSAAPRPASSVRSVSEVFMHMAGNLQMFKPVGAAPEPRAKEKRTRWANSARRRKRLCA